MAERMRVQKMRIMISSLLTKKEEEANVLEVVSSRWLSLTPRILSMLTLAGLVSSRLKLANLLEFTFELRVFGRLPWTYFREATWA